jgi:hypothetical protein
MSGGRPFDPRRFRALARIIVRSAGLMPPAELAWLMFRIDLDAYARLGASMTGATWLRGTAHPEAREPGWGWFEHFMRQPLWARAAGRIVAGAAVVAALKSARHP